MQVGPNRTAGVALALSSLHISVLSQYPRPVLLFFGDDVPKAQYSAATVTSFTPPEIRSLVEVSAKCCEACLIICMAPGHESALSAVRATDVRATHVQALAAQRHCLLQPSATTTGIACWW
jgi:hypothetical protein